MRRIIDFNKKRKLNILSNAGFTMVELIVSFALMGIFMIATTMAISTSITQYYHERDLISAFSLGDSVLSFVKEDIRTMQGSDNLIAANGYIKLRDADGKQITGEAGTEITGETLEFVMSSATETDCVEQIDAKGFVTGEKNSDGTDKKGVLIKNHAIINDAIEDMDSGYLTFRYYRKDNYEEGVNYKNCYMDYVLTGTELANSGILETGTRVARDAEERIAESQYQRYKIEMEFSMTPEDYDETSDATDMIVRYVNIKVNIIDADGNFVHSKETSVALQNKVLYKNENTMYSDLNAG
ncbi:MAG: type II secretion system GspH family protein [Lachnospiraceae bacterium]|nr:type II secretion system GspH family protein [Lachnospiraceae bacterium]